MNLEWLASPEAWVALLALTSIEIVLGIDNIIFLSILAAKLPPEQQARARMIGLSLAMVMRILLLLSLSWLMGFTQPLFEFVVVSVDIDALLIKLFFRPRLAFVVHLTVLVDFLLQLVSKFRLHSLERCVFV